jgi:hypothetical protein
LPLARRTSSPLCAVRFEVQIGTTSALLLSSSLLVPVGCKRTPPPDEPVGAPEEVPSVTIPPVPHRCAEVKPGAVYLIGEPGAAPADPEDEEVGLPSGAELGGAVGYAGGFAVAATRGQPDGTSALVALLTPDASSGRIVDLGRIHGDVDPPSVAAAGDQIFLLVADRDAGGTNLRLARLRGTDLAWGATFAQGSGDSQGSALAIGSGQGIVAWDEWDRKASRGIVRRSTFAAADITQATPARTISPAGSDVEGPQVVSRPGGFWLAWVSHSSYQDAGAPRTPAVTEDPESVVDLGPRWLEIVPLAPDGLPAAAPQVVTPREAQVLVFDLATAPDGDAWLAWRDDRSSPGVEKQTAHLARVRPDGTLEKQVVEDEGLGAGVPHVLVDDHPAAGQPPAWLALAGTNDTTWVAALDPREQLRDALGAEPVIRGAEPVALYGSKMLLARPRGTAVELSVARCQAGSRDVADGGTRDRDPE